jgi:hypothetical protein
MPHCMALIPRRMGAMLIFLPAPVSVSHEASCFCRSPSVTALGACANPWASWETDTGAGRMVRSPASWTDGM